MANTLTIFVFCLISICFILSVDSAPQLRFDDRRERKFHEADSSAEGELKRPRRGSNQIEGAFGHHHQSYHQPHGHHQQSYGHGHGHGYGHHQPIGPVFTFVRTDYHGNFQTGVRHKVGGGGHYGH